MAKRLHHICVWFDEDEEADINAFLIARAQLTASAPFGWHDFAQAAMNELLVKARVFLAQTGGLGILSSFVPSVEEIDMEVLTRLFKKGASSNGSGATEKRPETGASPSPNRQARSESS